MAGGIFVDRPFHPNAKCLIFGAILMLGYWYLPKRNPYMLPLIFVVAYIGMAWYDHLYNCDMKLYSGTGIGGNTIDTWGKPQRRTETDGEGSANLDQEKAYNKNVNLFHILAINMLLIYIGYNGSATNTQIFQLLLGLTVLALIYHSFRLFSPREVTECPEEKKEEVKAKQSHLKGVYLMHLSFIIPLLLYVGVKGVESDVRVFPVILSLGLISTSYHSWKLFNPNDTIKC